MYSFINCLLYAYICIYLHISLFIVCLFILIRVIKMEDKFQSMSTKSSMAQKELQRLKETNALLEVEAKELRYNRDQDRDTITLLQKQLAEKKNRTGSLQDKV